jgi:uncharacterized protein
MTDRREPVPSPCVRNCCLDKADICLGCFRTMSEIVGWSQANNQEREAILLIAKQREKAACLTKF